MSVENGGLTMGEKLQVRIYPDGRIEASTKGIMGQKCIDYIEILEEMLDAKTTDTELTADYYQENQLNLNQTNEQQLMG